MSWGRVRALAFFGVGVGVVWAGVMGVSSGGAWAQDVCLDYDRGDKIGRLDDKRLSELSGLVASRRYEGILWGHNDSGDRGRIFAIDLDSADVLGWWEVAGALNVDWEDVAMGPCGGGGGGVERAGGGDESCLYLADVGNNHGDREDQVIYRVREPDLRQDGATEAAEALQIDFAGDAPNIEAIFVDYDGTVYLVSKSSKRARLYRVDAWDLDPRWAAVAYEVAETDDIEGVTGADLAPDRSRFILRAKVDAEEFYLREGADIAEVFGGGGKRVDLRREAQGEAIAYAEGGDVLISGSEGAREPLYRYRCDAWGPPGSKADDIGGADLAPSEPEEGDDGCGSSGPSRGRGIAWVLLLAGLTCLIWRPMTQGLARN